MSIEVREFRIGNYVNTKYGNLKVFTINELGLEVQDNSGWIDYINSENLKPIEITEEILLKCGFKKIDHHRFKIIPSEFEFYYTISVHDNCFRIYVGDSIICANVIFYLHQLQNLYFTLTNQELEINL